MNTPVYSLRNYGYFTKLDSSVRRNALTRAVNVHGVKPVLDRLKEVIDLSKSEIMKGDFEWISNEMQPPQQVVNTQQQMIKLSKYGYSTKKSESERLMALIDAMNESSPDSVVKRLNYVINSYPNKKHIFEQDLNNLSTKQFVTIIPQKAVVNNNDNEASTSTQNQQPSPHQYSNNEIVEKLNEMRVTIKILGDSLESIFVAMQKNM